MFSPRHAAQLGLGAACLLLISCLVVLHSKASEAHRALRAQPVTSAPDFTLSDAAGREVKLSALRGSPVVLCFRTLNCPVSNDYDARLSEFARRFADAIPSALPTQPSHPRVSVLSINVGPGTPKSAGRKFTCLLDPAGAVADQYAVELTPTFFVLDSAGQVRYRGSFDDNRNAPQAVAHYCQDALQNLLHGEAVRQPLTAPFGCTLHEQVRLSLAR